MSIDHVDTERLVAFLDHQLPPAANEEVVAHFAECSACRREMTAVRQLLKRPEKRIPWHLVSPMVVALAASIVFFIVPSVGRVGTEPAGSIRSGAAITSTEQMQPITMMTPAYDAALDGRGAIFVWRAAGIDATYRLTVTDSIGTVVYAVSTVDTSAALPDSVHLRPGPYFWSVAARLRDARSAKTGARRFFAH
jgi:hypothetical protein